MRLSRLPRAIAAVALLVGAAPAAALNCYILVDRANEVIYQDRIAPVDLSDDGAPERDALRGRGQQLIAMDTDSCPAIDRARVTDKGGPASVEEIVAGMRAAVPYGAAANRRVPASGTDGGISLPRITVPRATGGGASTYGTPAGMSIR
jgi:hypothetical protein